MEQRGRSFCMFREKSDPLPLYAIHPPYPSTFLHIFLSIPPFFFRFVPFFFLSVLHRITYSLARLFTLPPDLRIFIRSRTLDNSLVIRPITVSDTRLFPFVADPTC